MTTLLIDNYDSNTFNLFQLLAAIDGSEPVVVHNDELEWPQLRAQRFSRCVISAGPGRPDRARDFGLSRAALEQAELPVLGVCLGHQGLALVAGGEVGRAPQPMHGRRSRVYHDGSELFAGIPQGFQAVRYHSLTVREPLPRVLVPIARTASGTVMAMRHRHLPQWGVQFHPESIETEHGEQMLRNFIAATTRRPRRRAASQRRPVDSAASSQRFDLVVREVPRPVDADSAFVGLFGSAAEAFWLDSSRCERGQARFSFMGDGRGPHARLVSHDIARGRILVGDTSREAGLLEWLDRALATTSVGGSAALPFDFAGGWVGSLGYELKAECGAARAHRSPLPDSLLLFADRLVAFDHHEDTAYIVCLTDRATHTDGVDWADRTARRLRLLPAVAPPDPPLPGQRTDFNLARPAAAYLEDIATCQDLLRAGESYEICLTNELRSARCADGLDLHRVLRRVNPAPFAAFLRLGGVEIVSSSPERFLALDRARMLEAKPIKGTVARSETPHEDRAAAARLRSGEKDRAENLMIVDVLRNDLGRVAEVGSVSVPTLMGVESYETVHQLVSTVHARLREDRTIVDCLRAAFPGGSMTGAPKLRTMELIDRLEGRPRGAYSGAIGWIGANGTADLSIAIRTIVSSRRGLSIGAGGAITVQSSPREELDELLLKARAPLQAVGLALHGDRAAAGIDAPPHSHAGVL
ncbi:MAG: aminodeoxychorismate synthase component I [Solirubrobacteraceae bacterium]